METLEFKIRIATSAEELWKLLWSPDTYRQWTQYIGKITKIESDWKLGGTTLFLDDENNGLFSTIEQMQEPKEVIFQHLGTYKNGVVDIKSQPVMEWSGIEEKYFLREIEPRLTELRIVVHTYQIYDERIMDGFNKGLELLKQIAESEQI